MASTYKKDPEAVIDFAFDWSSWLADAETIASETVTAETGLTVDSYTEASGVVTVWLSGGTAGQNYYVDCEIVTSAARTDSRRILVKVIDR